MKNKTRKVKLSKRKKGGGFISGYALVAASLAIILLTGLVVFVSSGQRQSQNEAARQQALQAAENGIYFYGWYLAHNLDGRNVQQIKNFWLNENPLGVGEAYEKEVEDFEGGGFGKYKIEVVPPDPDSTIVIVKSTGWTYRHPTIKRVIQVRFRRPSWSEYSVLANDFMRFGEGTVVSGPIHSNKGIRFDGVANNVVSSNVETYDDPDHSGGEEFGVHTHVSPVDPLPPASVPSRPDVFKAGREFPEPLVDFNGVTTDMSYMKEQASSGGIYLGEETYPVEECSWKCGKKACGKSGCCQICETVDVPVKGYHLILRTDDKLEIRRVFGTSSAVSGCAGYNPYPYEITDESASEVVNFPANNLVFVENYVWVEGTINTAKITIASAKLDSPVDTDIYINHSVTYTNKDGRDIIGLIAENNISVGLYSDNNLEIDAALLAQNGRVGRECYDTSSYRWRNEITVYGSIATNKRYGFAWTNGTGYDTRNLYFDNNLIYYPPPYFPTGSTYQLDQWEEL